jgi:outer membrane protein
VTTNGWKLLLRAAIVGGLSAAALAGPVRAENRIHSGDSPAVSPRSRTLVVDQQAVIRQSKVGQDVMRQMNDLAESSQNAFGATEQELQTEEQALQSLPPADREKKTQALQAKRMEFQQKVKARQSLMRGGAMKARQEVSDAVASILKDVLRERGADIAVDKKLVLQSVDNIDVTDVVIQRLDKKLPKLKVELVNPPLATMLMAH